MRCFYPLALTSKMQAGFSRLEKTDIEVEEKKHKAKEFHVISGIIVKMQVWRLS